MLLLVYNLNVCFSLPSIIPCHALFLHKWPTSPCNKHLISPSDCLQQFSSISQLQYHPVFSMLSSKYLKTIFIKPICLVQIPGVLVKRFIYLFLSQNLQTNFVKLVTLPSGYCAIFIPQIFTWQ